MTEKSKRIFPLSFLILSAIIFVNAGFQKSQRTLSTVHRIEGKGITCSRCHGKNNEVEPARCLECHTHLGDRIASKRGYHADKDEGCDACHAEHQGPNVPLIDWDPSDFDHEETGYTLEGKHRKVKDCRACHTKSRYASKKMSRSYLLKSNRCASCHKSPHQDIESRCLFCHHKNSWRVDVW